MTLRDYASYIASLQGGSAEEVLYCHDVPILSWIPSLKEDLQPFPVDLLPPFYRKNWDRYVQFFMGPKNSWTPLHFDCLLTNNIFFQIYGKKLFYFIDKDFQKVCERYDYRWFKYNPENSQEDGNQKIPVQSIIAEAGDLLYIPPGYLHAVKGLSDSISFNIDFHTPTSVLKSFSGIFDRMPAQNVYYNMLIFMGVCLGIPESIVYRYYRTYLNYVS